MRKYSVPVLLLLVVLFSSFVLVPKWESDKLSGEYKELKQKISLGKARLVKALINVKGGKLYINDNTQGLADVSFYYHEHCWSPDVSYSENDESGKLIVKTNTMTVKDKELEDNICKLALSQDVTYSLGFDMGIGIANVDMEGFKIDKALLRLGIGEFDFNFANTSIPLLKVKAGIGEAKFDLTGKWENDLSAFVKAGIGEIEFIVPENVGVRFKINGFLGEIKAPGFRKNGKTYINKAFGNTEHKLEFDVTGAIGSVKITQI